MAGFVNSETESALRTANALSGAVTYTTTYTATTAAGTSGVTITPGVGGLTADNYSFTVATGTVTVSRAASSSITPIVGSYTYSGSAQGASSATVRSTGSRMKLRTSRLVLPPAMKR